VFNVGTASEEDVMSNWVVLAALSAFFAALVAIFGKLAVKTADPALSTAVRAVTMSFMLLAYCGVTGKLKGISQSWDVHMTKWTVLTGIAGAASWLCYFYALRSGFS
jgi:transporter family protein